MLIIAGTRSQAQMPGYILAPKGGYTRIIKTGFRPGDAAEMAMIELVDFNEGYTQNKNTAKATEPKKKTRRAGGKKAAGTTTATTDETTGAKPAKKAAAKKKKAADTEDKTEE